LELLQVHALYGLLNDPADCEVSHEQADHGELEVLVREGHKLQVLADHVTVIQDTAGSDGEHDADISEELRILSEVLHERSPGVVNCDDSALKPPLVEEQDTVLDIGLELAVWNERFVTQSVDEGLTHPNKYHKDCQVDSELE
jgi:hypothetical protein